MSQTHPQLSFVSTDDLVYLRACGTGTGDPRQDGLSLLLFPGPHEGDRRITMSSFIKSQPGKEGTCLKSKINKKLHLSWSSPEKNLFFIIKM
jgi:hypothetical protein